MTGTRGSPLREVRARVRGRVQGVGYRYFVRDTALRFGVAGWVRNEPDGTVSLVAVGDEGTLREFLSAIRAEGDPFIRVQDISAEWADPAQIPAGFVIRRD
ncbi:MAG: acylphosphatase [Methanolinea sp.]|nr:acylphosphatase [Methanolinea sp.]